MGAGAAGAWSETAAHRWGPVERREPEGGGRGTVEYMVDNEARYRRTTRSHGDDDGSHVTDYDRRSLHGDGDYGVSGYRPP